MTTTISIVGGGLSGLVAAIECADAGADVHLYEAHRLLGGRARTTDGPFRANYGPHVVYADGAMWQWLNQRSLCPLASRMPSTPKVLFRHDGRARRVPPGGLLRALVRLRRHDAPADVDFQSWASAIVGDERAAVLARAAGVFTFDHDPGRLSAAFIVERARRVLSPPPKVRYIRGGWGVIVETLETAARARGVVIQSGARVDALPPAPLIVAADLPAARRLLGDESLQWTGARAVFLDVGLRARGDPFVISDLDEAGWAERFSAPDPSLAPTGHSLVQAHIGLRPDESLDSGVSRLEALLDAGFTGWRDREVWRRRALIDQQTGALDLPGTTWRDRPRVDRGNGVFVAGDTMAAPGLLGEVAVTTAIEAAAGAVAVSRRPMSAGRRSGP